MPLEYDCVIVGAGYVGASLAIALKQMGFAVAVVDGRGPLADAAASDARGIALSPSSKHILNELNVWSAIAPQAAPVQRIRVSERGRFVTATLDASDVGLDALAYVVPADFLLGCIERVLVECIDVRWRSSLLGVNSDRGERIEVYVSGHDQSETMLSCRLLIGADGVGSKVRELLAIPVEQHDYGQSAIVAQITLEGGEPATAYERFTSEGPLAMLPMRGDKRVVVRCCDHADVERLLGLSDDLFIAELTERFARPLGRMTSISPRNAHPLKLVRAERSIATRTALVGAAAVAVHPNAAQGLNLGLRDVVGLCASVEASRSEAGGSDVDIGAADVLEVFAAARDADRSRTIRFTDLLASGFASGIPGAALIRQAGMLGVRLVPALKRSLIYQGIGNVMSGRLPFGTTV